MLRAAVVAVALLAIGGVRVTVALADGDPASDYLVYTNVFVPSGEGISSAATGRLEALVREAKTHGYALKVALIASPYDLGSVPSLWLRPNDYATFLGSEDLPISRGPWLIVMPNGFGIFKCARVRHFLCASRDPLRPEKRLLASLPVPRARHEDVATAAIAPVRKLAALHGITLIVPAAKSHGGGISNRLAALVGASALVALVAVLSTFRRLRRR